MHHRYEKSNIPIELLRTFVAISESGSFTKSAAALNLSQSAVSAQVKRLQQLVAGELFDKSGMGLRLTELGEAVAGYARRILALNDQILALGGMESKARHFRLGIPSGFDEELLVSLVEGLSEANCGEIVQLRSESQATLLRGLDSGYLDVAFMVEPQQRPAIAAAEWSESMHWVRSPKFLLSPGSSVPLVSWPGSLSDRVAVRALEQSGIPYYVAFVSHDRGLRKAAVRAGVGIMVAAERSVVAAKLNVARDHYLPPLPPIRSGIYLREGLEVRRMQRILSILQSILRPEAPPSGAVATEAGLCERRALRRRSDA